MERSGLHLYLTANSRPSKRRALCIYVTELCVPLHAMLTEGTVPFIVVRASLHHIVINSSNGYSYNLHQHFGDVSIIGASIHYLNTSQHCYTVNNDRQCQNAVAVVMLSYKQWQCENAIVAMYRWARVADRMLSAAHVRMLSLICGTGACSQSWSWQRTWRPTHFDKSAWTRHLQCTVAHVYFHRNSLWRLLWWSCYLFFSPWSMFQCHLCFYLQTLSNLVTVSSIGLLFWYISCYVSWDF